MSNHLDQVTACITQHKRPESLERLLASIRKYYPELKILVEDTGGNLSAARNRLTQKCETPYMLLLEEDFVFTGRTKLEKLLTVLEANPSVGGVAGCTNEPKTPGTVNRGGKIWWDRDFQRIQNQVFLAYGRRPFETLEGIRFRRCDIVINFGIFRKEVFEAVPWPEDFPVMEHTPWYWEAYLDARWHFAYVPEVLIDHLRDRPSREYNRDRNRNFGGRIKEKYGVSFNRDNARPKMNAPNVVFLTVGRANSTILTKMAAYGFGLNLGNIDPKYYEHRSVRQLNQAAWGNQPLDKLAARRVLRSLRPPWIIKDPRFRRTLPDWLGPLQEFSPLLVYVHKNPDVVKESYEKQGWYYDPKDHERCEDHFRNWPGPKIRVNAAQIGIACSFFDFSRLKLAEEDQEAEGAERATA